MSKGYFFRDENLIHYKPAKKENISDIAIKINLKLKYTVRDLSSVAMKGLSQVKVTSSERNLVDFHHKLERNLVILLLSKINRPTCRASLCASVQNTGLQGSTSQIA